MIKRDNSKTVKGMSLVEILVVVSIFGILGMVTARSISSTLRSARKSDIQINVRENLNYATSVVERQIRGAREIINCESVDASINYVSNEGVTTSFDCLLSSDQGYLSSGSARLTSENIELTQCSFSCNQIDQNNPPIVTLFLTAEDKVNKGSEGSKVTVQTEITLRNY